MATNKGGRPKYVPTEADRNTVRNMAAAGIPQHNIRQCIGAHGISEPTLRKHFSAEMETAPHMVTGFAMSKLFKLINEENLGAICFWLKTKAGFQETSAHRLVDKADEDREIIVRYEDRPAKTAAE